MFKARKEANSEEVKLLGDMPFEPVLDEYSKRPSLSGKSCILEFRVDDRQSVKTIKIVALVLDWDDLGEVIRNECVFLATIHAIHNQSCTARLVGIEFADHTPAITKAYVSKLLDYVDSESE